jgi:hypothetical protein
MHRARSSLLVKKSSWTDRKKARSRRPWRALLVGCVALFSTAGVALAAAPANGAAAPASGAGWIRFGHFVPSQGPVTVTVDNMALGSNLVFRAVTPYLSVPAGIHTVTVRVRPPPHLRPPWWSAKRTCPVEAP